jgi:hypothetical protein
MKKTLARLTAPITPPLVPALPPQAPALPAPRRRLGTRLAGGLTLLTLLIGVGLFASSRPAHTAGGPIPVNIANVPLPTTPTTLAAPTQPFQHAFEMLTLSAASVSESITVPLHKRLVIEYISANLNVVPNSGGTIYLQTTAGGESVYYFLTDTIYDSNKRNQSVRIYADPGTTVTVEAVTGDSKIAFLGANTEVSGYYVDVP